MKDDVFVTVGIPVYNEESFLSETIQSVVDQSFDNIVIRISDNCSTDNSANIIREFAGLDKRITHHRHKETVSAIDNFKFLRDVSDTKYFMWLGAHDILKPGFIEEAVNAMETNDKCSLFYPRTKRINKAKEILPIADFESETKGMELYDRILTVFKNMVSSSHIHGVFRLSQLKKIPLTNDGCEEYLVFLISSVNGEFHASGEVNLLRREIREPESKEALEERYLKSGYLYTRQYSYFNFISFVLIKNIFLIKQLSYRERCKLFTAIKFYFIDKVSPISYNKIIHYFLFRKFDLRIVSCCILKKIHLFIKS